MGQIRQIQGPYKTAGKLPTTTDGPDIPHCRQADHFCSEAEHTTHVQELELSRLKHDKLSEMLAAASAAQQAADQKSRRLEIKFARSDKGHALMRSAKLQSNVTDLEAQVSQLQGDCHHQVRLIRNGNRQHLLQFWSAVGQRLEKAESVLLLVPGFN